MGWFSSKPETPAEPEAVGRGRSRARHAESGEARAEISERANRTGVPGVQQSPLSDRPDAYAGLRAWYGQPQSRGHKGPSGAVPARVALERREPSAGRPAHTEFLPAGRGRARRPASALRGSERPKTGMRWPNMFGGIFAGAKS